MNTKLNKTQTAGNVNKKPATKQNSNLNAVNSAKNNKPPRDRQAVNKSVKPSKKENLKVMFLGGVGEIGKNITVLEYHNDIIVIDCGLSFPSEDMPGIDIVIPDFSYLVQNKDRVRALVITHAHEDHIGAIPYFLQKLNVPIYGSKFTIGMIENKLKEFNKVKLKAFVVKPRQQVKIGCFNVEFIHVNHSIAGAMALAINTPVGMVVHSGDFKIDYSIEECAPTDLDKFAELGRKGVLLFLCESTNVCRPGHTLSESVVREELDKLFNDFKDKRIIIVTFSSNTYRLQHILDIAEKYKRKMVFTGRSMLNNSETAVKVGELRMNKENIIDVEKMSNYADGELCIITTGSQGEPMSGLTRMVNDNFNKVTLTKDDVVIFSSSPIPGNEKNVIKIENALYKKGVTVINDELEAVHASGHACQDEIMTIHALVKPKYFIPVHGEHKHMITHQKLAVKLGMEERNTLIAENGYVVEVNDKVMKHTGTIPYGERLIDGLGMGDADSLVLKDRKQLSEDGLCVCIVGLDRASGEITLGPDIITRGLVYSEEIQGIITEAKETVISTLNTNETPNMDSIEVRNLIKRALTRFFFKRTERKPMVLTIIIES